MDMTSDPVVLSVFISSTFQDMQSERDVLARLVFPRLRASLESSNAQLREVDLRWGVTELMARDGGALAVCLDAVAECFPMVVGIVGTRLGWRPPAEAVAAYDPEFARGLPAEAAITEIELRYAVHLARGLDAVRVPILFRSSDGGEDEEDAAALRALRRWLATEPAIRVVEYPTIAAFEGQAEEALREMAGGVLAAPRRGGASGWRTPRLERPRERRLISRAAARRRPTLMTGPSGAGLSWLARQWLEDRPGGLYIDGRETPLDELEAALGAPSSAPQAGAGQLLAELPAAIGGPASALLDRLGAAAGAGRVVVDHYEACFPTEAHADLAWVPTHLPRGGSVVFVSGSERLRRQAAELGWRICEIRAVPRPEGAAFARAYLRAYFKELTDAQAARLEHAPWTEDLRSLRLVLDELRRFGDWQSLDARLTELCACAEGWQIVDKVVLGLRSALPAEWRDSIRDILAAIALSLRGLGDSEILAVAGLAARPSAGGGGHLPPHLWSAIRISLDTVLVRRGARTDIDAGPAIAWVEREIATDIGLVDRAARALDELLLSAPPRRRYAEAPGLALARGGDAGLEGFLAEPGNALGVLAVGDTFAEGWFARLGPEARGRVARRWVAGAEGGRIPSGDALRLGMVAAQGRETEAARALLEHRAAASGDGDPAGGAAAEAVLALLSRDGAALESVFRALGGSADEAGWETRALVALAAIAEGTLAVSDADEDRLAREVARRGKALGHPLFDAQAGIMIGQIHLGRARWREALKSFRAVQRASRRLGHVRLLCQSLERECAARLELSHFRAARNAARECLDLSRRAGQGEFEALAFERLIEVERRRANWSRAYELATRFIERCGEGLADVERARRALASLERS